jgi:hypothetical protein
MMDSTDSSHRLGLFAIVGKKESPEELFRVERKQQQPPALIFLPRYLLYTIRGCCFPHLT